VQVMVLCIFVAGLSHAQLPCGQNIDLNTWTQEGDPSSGTWNVFNGGNSVEQIDNWTASWFVSPNDFINVRIQGTFLVNPGGDDDLIGFVFGYQNPIGALTTPSSTSVKSYFFDWKKGTQTYLGLTSNEGFALYEMDGLFDFTNIAASPPNAVFPEFWERVNSPVLNVINTDYGNNGWNFAQQYDFELKYTSDSIIIWIDGVQIFEEAGCFEPGRFGFYNHSQASVVYSDFSYDLEYDFEISDPTLCVNDTVFTEIASGCSLYLPLYIGFDWDFGDNSTTTGVDPSHIYSTPGVYDIELISSDSFGCADTSIQTIQIFDYAVSYAGVDDTSCTLSYNLSATASTGSWSGPPGVVFSSINSNNSTVSVPTPGMYTFVWEATNAAGCNAADSVSILFNEYSVSTTLTDPSCIGSDGEILLAVQGGSGAYNYQWDANANNQTSNPATNLSSGAFSVLITDSYGCVIDSTFNLAGSFGFSFSLLEINSDCDSSNGSATITNLNGGLGPYMFDWGTGTTPNNSIQNLSSGAYGVTITDANGCDSSINFNIQSNAFVANVDTVIDISCFGANDGSATVSGQNPQGSYSYQWGPSSNFQTTATASSLIPGLHSVIISTNSGCIDTLDIFVLEPPELVITQITNVSSCIGDSITLNANVSGGVAPYTYSWGNGIGSVQNPQVIVTQTVEYPLTILDNNGCAVNDTATVDAVGSPQASFSVDTLFACLSSQYEFTFYNTSIPQGIAATWDFGDQSFGNGDTVTHIYSSAGVYSVTLTIGSSSGCFDSYTDSNLIQIYPDPVADFSFSPNPVTPLNSTVQFTDLSYANVHVWNWTFDQLGSSIDQNPSFVFPQTSGEHLISLEVENIYGCSDSISKLLIVEDDINIFAPNTFTPDGDEFNQYWVIYANGIDVYNTEVVIYNRWGEQIWKTLDISIPWDGTYKGRLVPDGVYTWTIETKSLGTDEKHEFIGHIIVIK